MTDPTLLAMGPTLWVCKLPNGHREERCLGWTRTGAAVPQTGPAFAVGLRDNVQNFVLQGSKGVLCAFDAGGAPTLALPTETDTAESHFLFSDTDMLRSSWLKPLDPTNQRSPCQSRETVLMCS